MTVTTKAASSSFSPPKTASSQNPSGSGKAGLWDSVKQSKPHTVNRSTASAHTMTTAGSSATSEYRSGQKK